MINKMNTKIDSLIQALDFMKGSSGTDTSDYKEIYNVICQIDDDLRNFRVSLNNFEEWIAAILIVFKEGE